MFEFNPGFVRLVQLIEDGAFEDTVVEIKGYKDGVAYTPS